MPSLTILSKKILDQLSSEERQKLKKYQTKHQTVGEQMVKAQSEYTQYVRKTNDSNSLKARKLADKGFQYEIKAMNARDDLENYQKLLKKKYTSKK
jgi:hypothetical protein